MASHRFQKGQGKIPGSGKPKGFKSQAVIKREQEIALANAKIQAETPLEFFAAVLKDKNMPHKERKEAAKELLPYMHPKLTSIEARGGGMGHEERLAMLMAMIEDAQNG